ncbi:MAG: 3-hydroxyacyl-ACP dehydratase [Ferruginibacter sp.]|nr:3-hydroxyacyl-ACP dehydratase [Ferruginibacter sp.]
MVKKPADILLYIPQRAPFVMVDELVYSDETTTVSKFLVNAQNIFIEDDYLQVPALVENIAQTAAARAGYISHTNKKPVLLGYIGAIKNLEIFFLPKIGAGLVTEITIVHHIFNVTLISGKIVCNNKVIACCEMKIFISK